MKSPAQIYPLLFALILTSCSWLTNRKTLFDSQDEENQNTEMTQEAPVKSTEPVSRKEHEMLQSKYSDLQKRYEEILTQKQSRDNPGTSKLLKELGGKKSGPILAETVNVFDEKNMKPIAPNSQDFSISNSKSDIAINTIPIDDKEMEKEVTNLNQALLYINQGNYDRSLSILKSLEVSKSPQIRARSKFYTGELLFLQQEYDLAMQIFENYIQNFAFSGGVIKALGRLIVCSEKLNLKEKQDKYYSMLHDFFGNS